MISMARWECHKRFVLLIAAQAKTAMTLSACPNFKSCRLSSALGGGVLEGKMRLHHSQHETTVSDSQVKYELFMKAKSLLSDLWVNSLSVLLIC